MSDADWLTYNRDYAGSRYSPLAEINVGNTSRLRVQCLLQLGESGNFETSPIVHEGRMYVTTVHKVAAVDAQTCKLLWSYTYTPAGPEHIPSNRGAALYQGRLYRGTTDGHLLAFDALTGKLLWDIAVADSRLGYFISGAPIAFDGKIFAGEAGGDNGIRGHIYAFDAATGKKLWTFNVIPEPGELGYETWQAGHEHGGGPTWSSMAIDPDRRLIYVPTGNPGPDFVGEGRGGPNLYTDSVVALNLDSGKLVWYAQQVPHDTHDWDTAAAPALYERGGRQYMAVASKSGYLFVYDRDRQAELFKVPMLGRRNDQARLSAQDEVRFCPGAFGQFNGPGFSPATGMLFVGSIDRCDSVRLNGEVYRPGKSFFGGTINGDPPEAASGWIRGIDAFSGKEAWAVHRPSPIFAGMTPTAGGLLFTGDMGGDFLVLAQKTGALLFRFHTGGAIAGGISTYAVGGKQYVAVPTGNSSRGWPAPGAATMIVFALP